MVEAVSFFATESPHAIRNLRKRLLDAISQKTVALAESPAEAFPDYKQRIGEIQGLRYALSICDEMTKEDNR